MADIVDAATRSRMMSGIRSANTKPELQVRRLLHAHGFRFRLHVRDLPGRPDIVLPRYRAAIFVHGCFWHGHACPLFRMPATRTDFWKAKIDRNRDNDAHAAAALAAAGWRVATIWECALRGGHKLDDETLVGSMEAWLRGSARSLELPVNHRGREMKAGHLSQYFTGVAVKRLSAVEADVFRSNQHEFNGVNGLKSLFGKAHGKQTFPAKFIYLNDHDDDPAVSDGFLTWYDARENHPTRSEHRLYFPTTTVSECAAEGDLLVIARRPDGSVLVVIAENGSTIANQVQWLFGVADLSHPGFSVREELETEQDRIAFASRLILENIGVVVETPEENHLDDMLQKFAGKFPTTREFSAYARSTLKDVNAKDGADAALMAWMEREEILFRTLERHIIGDRLKAGFHGDVDGFIAFSLSVQNRRKSRVGYALENHLEMLFAETGIRYTRTAVTENKSKPDFLFPGAAEYHDPKFSPENLTMLGVKSTCKDRWRQVLAEANRIEKKHLLTLETAISTNQTDEMRAKNLQLVLPRSLHATYTGAQQAWLLDIAAFTELARHRQV